MILVICAPSDHSALQLACSLNSLGGEAVEVITCEELVYSPQFTHLLSVQSIDCPVHINRLDPLHALEVSGIINRIGVPPREHLHALEEGDRDYAYQELVATLASWLTACRCPVLNRPTAVSLSGPTYSLSAWGQMAVDSGLVPQHKAFDLDLPDRPANPVALRVMVFNGRVYGISRNHNLANACLLLSDKTGAALLEIHFSRAQGMNLQFSTATTLVDFSIGGEKLASDMLRYFEQSGGRLN